MRSCIIKLYDFVNRLWQYLQINSHFGRILRRKSDRQSSLSIRITANIMAICYVFWSGRFIISTAPTQPLARTPLYNVWLGWIYFLFIFIFLF